MYTEKDAKTLRNRLKAESKIAEEVKAAAL